MDVLPLYEAKMIHHYDHRFATYDTDGEEIRDATIAEKADPYFAPLPRYWVNEWEVVRTVDVPQDVLKGVKKEIAEFSEYRTPRRVLAAFDALADQFVNDEEAFT